MIELWVPGEIWTSNASRRMHHMAQANLVLPMRQAAMLVARNALNRGTIERFTEPVIVTFWPHQKNRGPAADTAAHHPATKAALDGIVDANVLHDDTPEWVVEQRFRPPLRVKAADTGVRIRIELAYT